MKARDVQLFSTWQWITLISGLCVTGVSLTAFAFNTFELKTNFEKLVDRLDQRFDRLEQKIDRATLRR